MLLIPEALRDAIKDYQYAARLPSNNEAIRQLIEAGLKASAEPASRRDAAE